MMLAEMYGPRPSAKMDSRLKAPPPIWFIRPRNELSFTSFSNMAGCTPGMGTTTWMQSA